MSMRDQAARRRSANDEGQIDLTPMLDVVFIMLIFFIVTSSFVKEPGVELFKPQASTMEACERGTIIFAVDGQGDIYYNKNKVPLDRVNRVTASGIIGAAMKENIRISELKRSFDITSPYLFGR